MKKLNQKLTKENVVLKQADEGKTIVIINTEEYSKNIQTFLATNNFSTPNRDPTDKYQKFILKKIQECNMIIANNKVLNIKETITTYTQGTIKII
jgi:hypothetical protein